MFYKNTIFVSCGLSVCLFICVGECLHLHRRFRVLLVLPRNIQSSIFSEMAVQEALAPDFLFRV